MYNHFRQIEYLFSQLDLSEAYSIFRFLSSDWIKLS